MISRPENCLNEYKDHNHIPNQCTYQLSVNITILISFHKNSKYVYYLKSERAAFQYLTKRKFFCAVSVNYEHNRYHRIQITCRSINPQVGITQKELTSNFGLVRFYLSKSCTYLCNEDFYVENRHYITSRNDSRLYRKQFHFLPGMCGRNRLINWGEQFGVCGFWGSLTRIVLSRKLHNAKLEGISGDWCFLTSFKKSLNKLIT